MKDRPEISAVINIRNEADKLAKCLHSLNNFANEIIVVDMQSTDGGDKIAIEYGAKVFLYKWVKFVEPARNFGLSKASGKWIVLLDPDESLGKQLKKDLLKIAKRGDVDYVKIPRKNIILGKWFRHTNNWPDYLIRFFKKEAVTWKNEIHSQPITRGNCLTLLDSEKLAIRHHNYSTVTEYIQKNIRYTNAQADELKAQDYKIKTSDFILKPIQEFNSRFFSAEGYKDGVHGLVYSILQSFSVALIYIRLWEKQGSSEKILSKESFVSASQESTYEYDYWFTKYFINEYKANIFKVILIRIRKLLNRLTKNF